MTLTAIISDIHGNEGALTAVLDDARDRGATQTWCLGDVVGYGARPLQCLQRLIDDNAAIIRGNHEQAVIDGPFGFNPLAAAAIHWTRGLLEDTPEHLAFVEGLGDRIDTETAVLVHGSPASPVDEYLFREETLDHLARGRDFSPKLARSFKLIDRPCFVGHTHVPGVIDAEMKWIEPPLNGDGYDTGGKPCIVNVGSVGQPRDGDVRASYALFDGRIVTFRRVDYDVAAAAAAIFNEPALPDALGQRLIEGW